jgi:hypothetical protein
MKIDLKNTKFNTCDLLCNKKINTEFSTNNIQKLNRIISIISVSLGMINFDLYFKKYVQFICLGGSMKTLAP